MATPNPLATIPSGFSYPLHLAAGLGEPSGESRSGSKKRKRAPNSVVGLRYNFKPASITPDTPGAIYADQGSRSVKFDLAAGGQQVFDAREEAGKSRECIMIWDEESQTFTLHPLSSTLHLTLNRSASSTASSGPTLSNFKPPPRAPSTASSSSSAAVPLAETHAPDHSRKKARPSSVSTSSGSSSLPPTTANRPVRASGKTVPRKQPIVVPPPAPAAATSAKGKGKTGVKQAPATPKSKAKARGAKESTGKGKIKSAEIIEDSDEDAAAYDEMANSGGIGEEDEFAMLLGQSLADDGDDAIGEDDEDEDEDDEEEEEEDEGDRQALGGAKVVVNGDGSEWL